MPFKLTSKAFAKYVIPGQETLLDKIEYFFTSDKSMSEKIGNLIYNLEKMDDEDKKAMESSRVDYKMQPYNKIQKLMSFSGQAVDFVVSNTRKYEGKAYATLENERDDIRQEIDSAVSSFNASHDVGEITDILNNDHGLIADRTFAVLGYTHSNLISLAKQFKDSQSGRLNRMKKMKFISFVVAKKPENFQLKTIHEASMSFNRLLGKAIDCYKYVDKFLFYTYKEMMRQNLIEKED